jgi:hypothetical protein
MDMVITAARKVAPCNEEINSTGWMSVGSSNRTEDSVENASDTGALFTRRVVPHGDSLLHRAYMDWSVAVGNLLKVDINPLDVQKHRNDIYGA